jgi:prevent-host-death family protein
MIITATELKNNLGKYLELAREDDAIIVTKNGEPIVRLVPFVTDRKAALNGLVGIIPDMGLTRDDIRNGRLKKK